MSRACLSRANSKVSFSPRALAVECLPSTQADRFQGGTFLSIRHAVLLKVPIFPAVVAAFALAVPGAPWAAQPASGPGPFLSSNSMSEEERKKEGEGSENKDSDKKDQDKDKDKDK